MAYSASAVANAFIERAAQGKISDLTPMKVQKLLFYTQSWFLKLYGNTPIIDDSFARWRHGPVITSLYHDLKNYGYTPVMNKITRAVPSPDGNGIRLITPEVDPNDKTATELIDRITEVYGKFSGTQLSAMTHAPGTAWSLRGGDGSIINFDEMANYIHPNQNA
ncbi:hypothetical protein PRCB_16615 [Pantoea rodasii]|uniref:Antitoxin SocA-like Panacea domain-containing protein n=1 Tax=Pantoea rodasii TaxID=1076549 RepID=A0A2M9WBV1_9GAMM|nr:type II toxin-antitoxin system antitoxin SocA domain-containing protein [Pantoea rodasii]ORM64547.1 hypothetical protein HA45_09285 [Pantoea rodasii]PJZ05021.1 hypothetical protein PRCB_16615 [Pantoea rodasii]